MKQLFILLCFSINFCFAQTETSQLGADLNIKKICPVEGEGRNDKEKELNKEKNRSCAAFADDVIDTISIDSILKEGNDLKRFSIKQLITVKGYVTLVKYGGAESCNCHSTDKKDWDIHIEVGKRPNDSDEKCFIAEVTPRYYNRDKIEWKELLGKKVEITGYIFYDLEHLQNAVNTNPHGTKLWRKTIVEIHPVINIVEVK